MAEAVPLFTVSVALSVLFSTMAASSDNKTTVFALLSKERGAFRSVGGLLILFADQSQNLHVVGMNIGKDLEIAFTPENKNNCETSKRTERFKPLSVVNGTSAEFSVTFDKLDPGEELYYLCVKQSDSWDFQGFQPWQQVAIREAESEEGTIFPLPVQIMTVTLLLFLSGLFSGLNLGLMALDKTELQIIEKCGSTTEKRYAKIIVPLRKRGNFLLCTLLLGNVMVNSTATILLDDLSNGVVAVVVSTICIVVFGEIIPQAVCSRHGLAVGAKTHLITRFFMIVTFPLSFPISLILDKILGEEIGQVYDKEKLQELIRMTADHKVLQNDEANIIAGALQLANKQVEDVMTKMEDVYMLDMNTVLDFEMMAEILKSGYTRVPVYDGDTTNIVNILNTKELALIDPDDNTPVKTVCRFYDHRPLFVDYDVRLDAMLQDFLQGNSHMAIVQKLRNDGDCDPYYENIGVLTLEDVIEEIIQSEIIDETDMLTDNRRKKPRERQKQLEYNVFEQKQEHDGPRISQQVAFAAYQFLSTAVEPFKEQYVVRSVLKQLIRQNIFITLTPTTENGDKNYLFRRGTECDYFVLLLEGHVEVEIGKENLVFESGPFNFFGVECLDCLRDIKINQLKDAKDLRALPPYIPDFSVRAVTPVQFLRIRRVHYLAARRTSFMMTSKASKESCHEQTFHDVWHKTLASSSISRNNSAAAIDELPDTELSPLGLVQKQALLSHGSLKDLHTNHSHQRHPSSKTEVKGEITLGDARSEDGKDGEDSLQSSSSCPSQAPDSPARADRQVQQLKGPSGRRGDRPTPPTLNGKAEGEGGDSAAAQPLPNCVDVNDVSLAQTGSDPEERKVGKAMGDKVPLVNSNSKEGRTAVGAQKGWAEEEDESAPLVSPENTNSRTFHS